MMQQSHSTRLLSALSALLDQVEGFVDLGVPFEDPENGFHDVVMEARAVIAEASGPSSPSP
ncbi:hypothetical protein [Azospirillum brasilense]|uniref:hypothetical protein n=1 Tax=Azospirillum brasilense TaxID=192 RepID=UPI000E677966|nr:hypothetical protein [Azospirillum brasilense]NUB25744.1 hypothetical protein [Azospirillum brasilense]NUB33882.1 hypothetical protein [Azospirillum brasilense]RIW07744.1 hypothetical protein D2T81_02585 [Azospirillum brasilense]